MSHKEVLIADLTQLESTSQVISVAPVLSSQSAQWNGVFFTHYRYSSFETPEHQWAQHLIGITGPTSVAQVEHRLNGQFHQHCYRGGEILMIPAGASYWSFWQQEAEFSLFGINPQFLEQVGQDITKKNRIELVPSFSVIDPLIQQIALALQSDLARGHPIGYLFGDSLVIALASRLLQSYTILKPQLPSDRSGLPAYRLKQASEYIESHLGQTFTLTKLADELDLSLYYFSRQFKQSTGIAPHQYITRRRIEQAKQLLWHSQLPITDIAFQVGFATPSAFTRLFRQLTGITPKAYRNQR